MAHAKRFLFSNDEQLFADFCKALGHPARYRIIRLLRSGRVIEFRDLLNSLPLQATTIQNHLNLLSRISIIKINQENGVTGIQLVSDVHEIVCEVFGDFAGNKS